MKEDLFQLLSPIGQEHLLAFWDELSAAQKGTLARQIETVDFELVGGLVQQKAGSDDWAGKADRAIPPPAARLNASSNPFSRTEAIERGRTALSRGEVAVVIVAGGQGTRLGFDHPKGMFSIGPVSGATLFRILFEKVLAASRRYGARIPLLIMTSRATHDETAEYLKSEGYFGLSPDDVTLFCQGEMPAVEMASGKLLLASKHELALSPDGHGGMLAALAKSGSLDALEKRGIRQLFYCQVDNPLVPMCDPEFLGYHLLDHAEVSTQVVAKQSPLERVGNVVMVDGRMMIIEYSDLPDDVAHKRNPDGSLYLWAGNTGIHVFDLAFLRRMSHTATALPFHLARKKMPCVGASGEMINPETPNALKFERFIFDLLPAAERAFVMEVDPRRAFAPVKNASGEKNDTPETVRAQMIALHSEWLASASAKIDPGVAVEISPQFAMDESEVVTRAGEGRLPSDLHVTQPRFFC